MMTILLSYLFLSFTVSGVFVLVMLRRATARYHHSAEMAQNDNELGASGGLRMLGTTSDDPFRLHQG
jgi:hypothetical protein